MDDPVSVPVGKRIGRLDRQSQRPQGVERTVIHEGSKGRTGHELPGEEDSSRILSHLVEGRDAGMRQAGRAMCVSQEGRTVFRALDESGIDERDRDRTTELRVSGAKSIAQGPRPQSRDHIVVSDGLGH